MKHQVVRVNNLMYKGCEFTATRHEYKIRGLEEAIEIVKRGGKNEGTETLLHLWRKNARKYGIFMRWHTYTDSYLHKRCRNKN